MSNDPLKPSASGRPGGQPTVDNLLATITGHIDSPAACAAAVSKAQSQLQGEMADKRIRLVVAAMKEYQQWLDNYERTDKPTGVFFTKDSNGEFKAHHTYSEELVKRLATLKENIGKLREAVNDCLVEGAKGEVFDKLAAVCKDLHIWT
jgi:acyl transferase domain-containing protein